jgi:serine/threonine protein kinase/WD40 repeat protein
MPEPIVCPKCAAVLPADAPAGLCAKCLLQAALASESALPDDAVVFGGSTVDEPCSSDQSGTIIGHYKLLQQIGEGGMGIVYFAEQLEPVRRKVALKIIKPGLDSRHVVARFEAERQALALMDHQHIARVLDAGTTGDAAGCRPYFVMELVKGVPITDYCDKNQLSIRERLELLVPVCQAIQHAHQKGIIHRDIKPSNVLVCLYDGRPVPKVIDFGVAKAIEQPLVQQTLFTQYGQIVGTLEYMSPEQAELNQLDVDTRSDIYSLGVLLYELLTGTTPLTKGQLRQAAFTEMLRLIREAEPERPSTRLSRSGEALATLSAQRRCEPEKLPRLLRGELDWIVLRCLEKERTRRYATAADLARDVERHLHDEPVEACPPSVGYRLQKTARKYRLALTTAVAFLGLLIAGITVSTWQAIRATHAELQAVEDRGKALEAEKAADQEKNEALRAQHNEEQARKSEAQRAAELREALRRSESLRLTAQSTVVLQENPGLALLLALEGAQCGGRSPVHNNALLAALTRCRELRTLHVATPPGHRAVPSTVSSARFSRYGGSIVTTLEAVEPIRFEREHVIHNLNINLGAAQIWTNEGGLLATIPSPPHQYFAEAMLSPDGRLLAGRFADSSFLVYDTDKDWDKCERRFFTDRVVRIWEVSTGKELHVLRGHRDRVVAISFSPDSRRFLTASWDKTCRLWDVKTGQQLAQITKSSTALDAAAFSPDGRRILTVSSGQDRDANYDEVPRTKESPLRVDLPLAGLEPGPRILQAQTAVLARNSSRMAIDSISLKLPVVGETKFKPARRSGVRVWDASTGKEIAAAVGDNSEPADADTVCATFTEDSRQIFAATSRGAVHCISAENGKRLRQFSGRQQAIRSLALSPDGLRLLLVYEDNSLAVLDAVTGKELRSWPSLPIGVRAAILSSEGRHVVVARGRTGGEQAASFYTPESRAVSILDVATSEEAAVLKGHEDDVTSVSISPDGRQLLTASQDGTARLWQVEEAPGYGMVLPGLGPAMSASFSPDGRHVLVAHARAYEQDSWDSFGHIWETATGKRIASLRGQDRPGASAYAKRGFGGVRVAQFSADGKRVLTLSADKRVGIIKPDAPLNLLFTTTRDKWPLSGEILPTPVRVWDVETGRELAALKDLKSSINFAVSLISVD